MLKQNIKDKINVSVGKEMTAHNMYTDVANKMQGHGYYGAEKYFRAEAAAELSHAKMLTDYMNDCNEIAKTPMIEAQENTATTLSEAFDVSMYAESTLAKHYQDFYKEAEESDDCQTAEFLLKFIKIQRKAVGEVRDIQARIKLAGTDKAALLLVDSWLGSL